MTETRISLSRPDLSGAEVAEVLGVLRSPFLSIGPKVVEFEPHFAAFLGVQHAVAVANGTCGLHLALRAVGVGPGTEVLTTPFTFVATANAILVAGGRPVFVDVDAQTLNVTPDGVAGATARDYVPREDGLVHRVTGMRLAAIMPVATFGHPVEMDGLRAVAREIGLPIVHDTCESFGSLFRSAEKGAWISEAQLADAAVYAFYPNKQITTGEGGMVVTADAAIAERCRMERNQGRRPGSDWLDHEGVGVNHRMDGLSAAPGVAELRRGGERAAPAARGGAGAGGRVGPGGLVRLRHPPAAGDHPGRGDRAPGGGGDRGQALLPAGPPHAAPPGAGVPGGRLSGGRGRRRPDDCPAVFQRADARPGDGRRKYLAGGDLRQCGSLV